MGVQVWCWAFVQTRKLRQEARANAQCSDKKTISVRLFSLHSFPFLSLFSSGVGGVSVLNMGSMVLGQSMASGRPGLSGLTAPEPVEEGSCTGSAPAPVQGIHTCYTSSSNPSPHLKCY